MLNFRLTLISLGKGNIYFTKQYIKAGKLIKTYRRAKKKKTFKYKNGKSLKKREKRVCSQR